MAACVRARRFSCAKSAFVMGSRQKTSCALSAGNLADRPSTMWSTMRRLWIWSSSVGVRQTHVPALTR
eukprot:8121568-Heterocapsa_arctica.AAC.1